MDSKILQSPDKNNSDNAESDDGKAIESNLDQIKNKNSDMKLPENGLKAKKFTENNFRKIDRNKKSFSFKSKKKSSKKKFRKANFGGDDEEAQNKSKGLDNSLSVDFVDKIFEKLKLNKSSFDGDLKWIVDFSKTRNFLFQYIQYTSARLSVPPKYQTRFWHFRWVRRVGSRLSGASGRPGQIF